MGVDGDLVVSGPTNGIGGLLTVTVTNYNAAGGEETAMEWLSRGDVERLRDLCDEALT